MMRKHKPYTLLGKFLAVRSIEENLTRPELAARIGIGRGLLHKLMHETGYKLVSVDKVIAAFPEEIDDTMAKLFRENANTKWRRHTFVVEPDSHRDRILSTLGRVLDDMSYADTCDIMMRLAAILPVQIDPDGSFTVDAQIKTNESLVQATGPPGATLGPPEVTDQELQDDPVFTEPGENEIDTDGPPDGVPEVRELIDSAQPADLLGPGAESIGELADDTSI